MKNLPAFSVRNALLVNLLSLFVMAAGGLSLFSLQRDAFPNFSFDIVSINTTYPGATPEEVEKLITHHIEEELKAVSDIDEISSVSAEGISLVVVKIEADADDKSKVVTDIQRAVDRVSDFPSDLEDRPQVEEIKTEDAPIIEVVLWGDLDRQTLQTNAEQLEKKLEHVPEVSRIIRGGWRDRQLWVEVRPKDLWKHRIAMDEVVNAVRGHNVNIAGGTLDTGEEEFLVRATREFEKPGEVEDVVVRTNDLGRPIRIRDIGSARWAFEDAKTVERVNGKDAVRLIVVKRSRGDAIRMVDLVQTEVEAFSKSANPKLEISYINDISYYVKRRLNILTQNGIVGFALVLITLFLLLSRSVAFWTAAGLPVAMGAAIWAMSLLDISVNLISMFGLIMVIGILVDDAIVVAENVFRYKEMGLSAREAAVRGASEVARPVTSTILTTIVAFLPLAFMSGIFGKFVRAIPFVVIITLVASLIEALMVLPSHLAEFSGKQGPARTEGRKRGFGIFDRFRTAYLRVLDFSLRFHKTIVFGAMIVIVSGIIIGFKFMPLKLFPAEGIEIFFIRAEAKLGTSLERTSEYFRPLEKMVSELPSHELDNYVLVTGLVQQDPNDPFTIRGSHVGQIIVYLTPENKRDRTSEEIMQSFREKIGGVPNFERIWVDQVNPGPPQGKPVALRIRGTDYETLRKISAEIQTVLKSMPGIRDVDDDYDLGKEEIRVVTRPLEAAAAGLTPQTLGRAVRRAFEGEVATVIRSGEEETDVLVRLTEDARSRIETFGSIHVLNSEGFHIPLSKVSDLRRESGIAAVKHFDRRRTVTVTANIDEAVTTSFAVNTELKEKLAPIAQNFPGYGIDFGGEYEDTQESMDSLMRAFILASFMIFLILASTFQSILQPLVVMLSIPYCLLAAIAALALHGKPLSFLAMLGMIGLAGVAVNDAIVLIEFINEKRRQGMDTLRAAREAGDIRLRPVLLTSVTTIVGLGPVAYGIGGKDPFLMPMALTITWGILLGTVLTLTLIPCAYVTVDDLARRIRKTFGISESPAISASDSN